MTSENNVIVEIMLTSFHEGKIGRIAKKDYNISIFASLRRLGAFLLIFQIHRNDGRH